MTRGEETMQRSEFMELLQSHESTRLEFKEARKSTPQNAYETVSAFANTVGGLLVLGVKDNGPPHEVVGVEDVDNVQNEFVSTLRQREKISVDLEIEVHCFRDVDGGDVLVFIVPEASRTDKPVFLNGDRRRSFIRRGACDVRCNSEEIARFVGDSSVERYDGRACDFDVEECLSTASIAWYREEYEHRNGNRASARLSDIDFLMELGLLIAEQRACKPTMASVLLFGRNGYLRSVLPRPVLDCQRFESVWGDYQAHRRWSDRRVFDSNLIGTWQGVLNWQDKFHQVPFELDFDTLQHKAVPSEFGAFREAAVNVLIHQDYSDHCRHPELLHFEDRTIFRNPGDSFAPQDEIMRPGEKAVRNPRIVTAFRRIGLSENAGRGLRDIFSTWRESGNIPPTIDNDRAGKKFVLVLHEDLLLTREQLDFQSGLDASLDDSESRTFAYLCLEGEIDAVAVSSMLVETDQRALEILHQLVDKGLARVISPGRRFGLAESLVGKVPPIQDISQILNHLSSHHLAVLNSCQAPRTAKYLMEELGLTHKTHYRRNVLQPLLEMRLIRQSHPDRPTHPEQSYSLTEQGLKSLETMDQ